MPDEFRLLREVDALVLQEVGCALGFVEQRLGLR